MAEMPDRWDKMRLGDRDAMLALYESYYNDLLSYGVQLSNSTDIAKDAINDVFLHLWEHHSGLKPVKNVKAYLFACIRRKIFQPVYANKTFLFTEEAFAESTEISHEEVLIAVQQSDAIRMKVKAALDKLTERQKELIYLKYFRDMDYREIGLTTGMSLKTAYNTIYNAIKILTGELRDTLSVALLLLFYCGK